MKDIDTIFFNLTERIEMIESRNEKSVKIFKRFRSGKFSYYRIGEVGRKWVKISEEEYNQLKYDNKENVIQKEELHILSIFTNHLDVFRKKYRQICKEHFQNYNSTHPPKVKSSDDILPDWHSKSSERNERKFTAQNGEKVRSKSEMIIADLLYKYNLDYEYECPMFNGKYHPDFLITDHATGKKYIWEHFGLMSDSAYVLEVLKKIEFYREHGYILNLNFIASYEYAGTDGRGDISFGSADGEKIIKEFFGEMIL